MQETVHIDTECNRLEGAMECNGGSPGEVEMGEGGDGSFSLGTSPETTKFIHKYFGQLLELPQLLLNKSQLDISSLIQFCRQLNCFPPPLRTKLYDIFPLEIFTQLKTFLENLGLNLQHCILTLFAEELPAPQFKTLINTVIQHYCETLCPVYKTWHTCSAQNKYEIVLASDYIRVLTSGPVLFSDFYGRVFEKLVTGLRDNKQKTELQSLVENYVSNSKRKKSIKADLAATWQMIVQFLLLFKGANSSLKKISPEYVSEESLQCVRNVCSYFEVFTDLTNLVSALSVGFKTSESMIEHIKGWNADQLAELKKNARAFIQSIHPRDVEFYPVPKRDKIRDSRATLYLFSDKLFVKICREGFSSQFLRGLGYHLPDITIYDLKDMKSVKFEKASPEIMEQYSIPSCNGSTGTFSTPMVLTIEINNARTMEVVFKNGPEISDQDKQCSQFVAFLLKLRDIVRHDLYAKCTQLSAPARLDLLNEIARSWNRVRELEKVPEVILHENPGLLGEVAVEKFSICEKLGRPRSKEVGRKGVKGCRNIRLLIFTDALFVTLVGQNVGVNDYTIGHEHVTSFSCAYKGGILSVVVESRTLDKAFFFHPEVVKGPAGVATKTFSSIKNLVNCFNEIHYLRLNEQHKLRELHVHAKDPELKVNRR